MASRKRARPWTHALLQLNAGIPAALRQKRLRIGHFRDFAKSAALVCGMLLVRFDDAISEPVAEVARLFTRSVVKPFGKISLFFIKDKRALEFLFTSFSRRSELRVRDLAENLLAGEFRRAFDQVPSSTLGCSPSLSATLLVYRSLCRGEQDRRGLLQLCPSLQQRPTDFQYAATEPHSRSPQLIGDPSQFFADLRLRRARRSAPPNQRLDSTSPNRRRSPSRRSACLRNLHEQVAGIAQSAKGSCGASRNK